MHFPSIEPRDFCWATGIEDTFIPHSRPGLRALDEYELTQHYQLCRGDFDRVAESGAKALRWGIPWYRVQPAPNRWEWGWVDDALDYLVNVKGIAPILDLMHYGTPLWLENSFINHSYPQRVAEYAAAVTERYRSQMNMFTPLNEPTVNADFCGRRGEWPPYLSGDDGYVQVFRNLGRGMVETVNAIRAVHPQAVLVQVEALWRNWTSDPAAAERVRMGNEQQYLMFDLTTGRVTEQHPLYPSLRVNGMSEADFIWFRDHAVTYDVFGANFYPWSYGELVRGADGNLRRVEQPTHGSAIAEVLSDAYRRYGLPVMVTETSATEAMGGRAAWMDDTIAAVFALRREGVPITGYTWFPLLTMIDWAYRRGRKPVDAYLLNLGLYESTFDADRVLQRQATSLVERYRQHACGEVPAVEKG